ncbi:MAG: GNAT family N-acetyltransferase [Anaerolineales bacterium]|jgi:GNAT superfamily N-acetyltransferase
MSKITYRWIDETDSDQFKNLDRSEVVRTAYEMNEGELIPTKVEWDIPTFFPEGEGEHSVAEQILFCRTHLNNGGKLLGAFDGETLVGVGLLTPEVRYKMAQLAYLHVSTGYRRKGIAARLLAMLTEWASNGGARQIYVSATPTESAVGFYMSQGFSLIDEPLPELFELEPEDIHMIKNL